MKKYLVTAVGWDGQMGVTYDLEGTLQSVVFSDDCNWGFVQRKSSLRVVPGSDLLVAETFEACKTEKGGKAFSVTSADVIPTFEEFWAAYPATSDEKGNKKPAQDKWDALSNADRMAAFAALKDYKGKLKRLGYQAPQHVKTWLNQRGWIK